MASPTSKKVIYAALVGNTLIAVTKFAAAAVTGSSAMLSEAIHSVVDTGNQLLLLYGVRRAGRAPDERHPFGYGMELYFWTFVVAILIFGVGAGISVYEGVERLLHPAPVRDPYVNYIVLAIAMVFEAGAWWVAYGEFRRRQGRLGLFAAVRESKDPTVFTVLFEDSAAMLGLCIALVAIAAGEALGLPELDAVGSLLIGGVLAGTAALLAYESKGLLVGESALPQVLRGIERILRQQPEVRRVYETLTMHLGPNDVLLNLSLDFDDRLSAAEVEAAIGRIDKRIRRAHPEVTRIFVEARGRASSAVGD